MVSVIFLILNVLCVSMCISAGSGISICAEELICIRQSATISASVLLIILQI